MIVQHFAAHDFFRTRIVSAVVQLHCGIFQASLLIVLKARKNAAVHLRRTLVLLMVAIAACILKEPVLHRAIGDGFVEFYFGKRIFVVIEQRVALLIQRRRAERFIHKLSARPEQPVADNAQKHRCNGTRQNAVAQLILERLLVGFVLSNRAVLVVARNVNSNVEQLFQVPRKLTRRHLL